MTKSCFKLYGLATTYRGRMEIFNTLLKFLQYFVTDCLKFTKTKLFQKTQMCFNETDHVMQHTIMKIVTANGAKMTHKMLQ